MLKAGMTKPLVQPGHRADLACAVALRDLRRPSDCVFLMEAAMRRMRFVIFTVLLGFCSTAEVAGADNAAAAWKALRAGGHVALMRHADAPGGFGDPPELRVDDCATQRNLSEKGRADAAKIGAQNFRAGRDRVRENPQFAVVPILSTRRN